MMKLFDTLERYQKKNPFFSSDEMRFYLDNRVLLDNVPSYSRYLKADNSFDIVRANIILRAIINKQTIEQAYLKRLKASMEKKGEKAKNTIASQVEDLPFYDRDGEKIFVPIFGAHINRMYSGEYEKLNKAPYDSLLKNYEASALDPFDYYGDAIFNSYFTKLVLLTSNKEGSAYFDYDADAIYFVNKQGRLDCKICLFDKYIKKPNKSHLLNRIAPVVEKYYEHDRDAMMTAMVENGLLSSRLANKINISNTKTKHRIYGEQ